MERVYKASPMQQGMYFHDMMSEQALYYNQVRFRIHGSLKVEVFRQSVQLLADTHEVLRSRYYLSGDETVLVGIKEPGETKQEVTYEDISHLEGEAVEAFLEEEIRRESSRRVDLEKGPLMHLTLYRIGSQDHVLIWGCHHIALDGWCMSLLIKELFTYYEEGLRGDFCLKEEVPYSAYLEWLGQNDKEGALAYWKTYLQDRPEAFLLPTGKRVEAYTSARDLVSLRISREKMDRIKEIAAHCHLTVSTLVQGLWGLALCKYSNRKEAIWGCVTSGRSLPIDGIEKMVGLFIHTLPLVYRLEGEKNLPDQLKQLGMDIFRAEFQGHVSLNEICDHPQGLFNHIFAFENLEFASMLDGVSFDKLKILDPHFYDRTNYDLTIKAQPSQDLYMEWHYNPQVYEREGIEALAEAYEALLDQFLADPEKPVKEYRLLSDARERALIQEINKNYRCSQASGTTQSQWIQMALQYPDKDAICEGEKSISYRDLLTSSKRVAAYLKNHGAKPGSVIGVDAQNSLETIACILGILMAGCAYLPLDLKLPEKRRAFYVSQTKMELVFSDLTDGYPETVTVLSKADALACPSILEDLPEYRPEDLAYIIFTSGSTGEPKGVCVSTGALYQFGTLGDKSLQHGSPQDRVAQIAVLSFDASIYEIFTTLMTGGTIVVASDKDKETAVSLTAFYKREGITRSFITMQLFALMVDEDATCFAQARSISAGGERASARHFFQMAKANPQTQMINGYGPTECICLSSGYHLSADAEWMEEIPIGYPEENHTYYVIDEDGHLCPPYGEGELYIGGANASGYFGREDLTREQFIESPYEPGRLLYRSGDMVKYIPGQGMVYLHRRDQQVKIRGFRIEAGEIENAIRSCTDVKQGCVRILEKEGTWRIYGYYVSHRPIHPEEIKDQLTRVLPSYMIPSGLAQLPSLPLNKNGKLDPSGLPDILTGTDSSYIPAQNDLQQKLLEIWQEVLGNRELGIRHDFFEAGGDSIKAMQIIGLLKKYGYQAQIRSLFQNPTVEKFSRHVHTGLSQSQEALEGICELLPIQKDFFAHRYPHQNQFNQSILLKMKQPVGADQLARVLDQLTAHHDMLRAQYSQEAGVWIQRIRPVGCPSYEIHEYRLPLENHQAEVEEIISQLQKGLDLERGILLQVGLISSPEEVLVFLTFHHMVMDGVSFRILLRDFGELLRGIEKGEEVTLLPKTLSYGKYAQALQTYGKEEGSLQPWENVPGAALEELSAEESPLCLGDRAGKMLTLKEAVKEGIEAYAKAVRGTEFADVLLAVVGKALQDVCSLSHFAVDIEHHGRGFHKQAYDLSNTIGWFTAIYPFIFDIEESSSIMDLAEATSAAQQVYRQASAEYMAVKMADGHKPSICRLQPQICFNYLGSFDSVESPDLPFEILVQNAAGNRAPDQETPYTLEINALILGGSLQMMVDYDSRVLGEEKIDALLDRMTVYAQELKAYAKEKYYEPFPLSSLQMAYYIGKQDFYELGGFTTHNYIEMETEVDIQRLNEALQKLIVNQEMLRTVVTKDGKQEVLREIPTYKIEMEDLRGLSREDQEARIQEKRRELSHYVFDIHHFPLFDIGGFRLSEKGKYLFIGYDTIMLDSGSANLLIRDLAYYYLHPEETPQPLSYHYQDYIRDWERMKSQAIYEEARQYWAQKLETFPEAPQLPMICDPDQVTKGHFLRKVKRYSKEQYGVLKRQSGAHGMTISALLLSVYAHTMNYYSGTDRFALNLTIFNRPDFHKDIERLYGDFTSTILLDFDLSEGKDFWEESEKVQYTLGKALEYRIYDGIYFSRDVMRKFHYPKTKAMMPMVFTSILFEQDIWEDVRKLGEVKWQIGQTPQVYVDFNVLEQAGELVIQMDYVSELFEEDLIDRVFQSYCQMLEDVAEERDQVRMPSLTPQERQERAAYNDTWEENPLETSLVRLFRDSVRKYPGKIALICGQDQFTYEELDRLSDRVAYDLTMQGQAGKPIGLYTERKAGTVINILGILKAGGCYVPILPEFPRERVNYIMKTGQLVRMLYPGEYQKLPEAEEGWKAWDPSPEDSAYILFTSGSTGNPKGVEIAHKSAANAILGANAAYGVTSEDVIIGMSEMSFDMSVYDIFASLGRGGRLVMVPDVHAIEEIAKLVEKHQVSVWQTVPALMQMYMGIRKPDQGSSLRHIALGGDFIPKQLARDILEQLPKARLMSIGGPTEIAIMDICYPVREVKEEWKSIPYGYPIRNSQIYIMDPRGRECPHEIQGEIWAGGMGLAKGYVGLPELTRERFVEHPVYGRLFKTGDYGIFKKEGYVEICGRQDGQVKIRGMRIELGEIENVFLRHPGVSQAAALIHEEANGSKQIAVFLEADPLEYSAKELTAYAEDYLTDYMRPGILRILKQIPLSKNNKIDRRRLAESLQDLEMPDRDLTPPENERETALLAIWKSVLMVKEAGVEDDFFESGGDSLKAMELLARIKSQMDWEDLLLTDILKAGSIRKLAQFKQRGIQGSILRQLTGSGEAAWDAGERKKVFFIHGGNGSCDSYRQIVRDIEGEADCYGIDFLKTISLEPRKILLKSLAKEYAEAILAATKPEEEVTLAGWCIGGTISFEIAYLLEQAGYRHVRLMLIDSQEPGEDQEYDYSPESELAFIRDHSFGLHTESLADAKNAAELWNQALALIEAEPTIQERVKEVFLQETAGILLHPDQLSVQEALMLNNFFRSTVDNAHHTAVSGKLTHTEALYIWAGKASVADHPEKWQNWLENPLEIRKSPESHFEILDKNTQIYSDWLGR